MCATIEQYPDRLSGGYYDGAKLIGTLGDGTIAEYYNPNSHGVVRYEYNTEKQHLEAEFNPERPLAEDKAGVDHIQRVMSRPDGGYNRLSEWAHKQIEARHHE
jgi:hypothetical protein